MAISLRGLALRDAFGPLDADIEPGSYTQVTGAPGSGGAELLLTLAGRLRGFHGIGILGGYRLEHRQVRKLMAVARVRGAIQSDEHLRIRSLIRNARLSGRALQGAWELVGIRPDDDQRLADLAEVDKLLVETALAVATGAKGIVLDGADAGLPPEDVDQISRALHAVAQSGRTVIATTSRPDDRATQVITLPDRPHLSEVGHPRVSDRPQERAEEPDRPRVSDRPQERAEEPDRQSEQPKEELE